MKESIPKLIFLGIALLLIFILIFIKIIIFGLLIVTLIYVLHKFIHRQRMITKRNALLELNEQIKLEIENTKKLEPISNVPGLSTLPDEVCLLFSQAVAYVPIKEKTKGHFESLTVPLPLHLHANLGQFSLDNAKYKWSLDGMGNIYLTDKRFVFISEFGNHIIPFKKLINVTNLENGIRLDIEGKKPIVFNTGDARLYFTYHKLTYKSELDKMLEIYDI